MFGKNTYLPFPPVSSSNNSGRGSIELNGASAAELFLHHHPELLSGYYLAANAPVLEAAALFNQDSGCQNGAISNIFPNKQAAPPPPPPSKKDRHSKIYTSQGPRDRRVRLSIGIARKFFDLQEMLGFDKPSKTLDWLLTKSKTAIKELVQTKTSTNSSHSDQCEEETNGEGSDISMQGPDSKGKSTLMTNSNKSCYKSGKDPNMSAKESRAKARARARERTKEKMSMKQQMNDARNIDKGSSDHHHQWNNHSNNIEIHQSCCSNGYEVSNTSQHMDDSLLAYDDLIQETMRRKAKNSSSVFGFHPNFASSASSENNWDYNTFASRSNLCAILDQHKFMN